MYINYEHNPTKENHKCEDCRNENICKYCGDMREKREQVDKIPTPTIKGLSPIKITISCKNFEKKPLKQDGFPAYR